MNALCLTILSTALSTTLLAIASPTAAAGTLTRSDFQSASGMCNPATYVVSQVRNRPSGIRNESGSTLYVTCSAMGDWRTDNLNPHYNAPYQIRLRVANFDSTDQTINCTLLTGIPSGSAAGGTTQGAFPQGELVESGTVKTFIWTAASLLGSTQDFGPPQFSCALPPQTEVQYYMNFYYEDIGS